MSDIYTIILYDGTEIKDLTKNGNNYISDTLIDESMFLDNLIQIEEISYDGIVYHTMIKIAHITKTNNKWWFSFTPLSEYDLLELKIKSDIEYIAMMTDIDI